MIKGDRKYHGKVGAGSEIIESQSGTLGYQVMLECEDGNTSFTIWLTQKNKERALKTFTEVLGVAEENLQNYNYIENKLGQDIAGRDVTFVTEEEEYKDKKRIKVAFLFKRSASGGGNPAKAAAAFFTKPEVNGKATNWNPTTDDDIPF